MNATDHELTPRDMMSIVARRWKIILLPASIAALVTALVLFIQPNIYESYALLKIGNRGSVPFETVEALGVVMDSPPMMGVLQDRIRGINKRSKGSTDDASVEILYTEVAGLLRISAKGKNPEMAAAYVRGATDLVFERHQRLYAAHLQELASLIQFVKSVIKPIPLSSGMNDFRVEPTRIEVKATVPQNPMPTGAAAKISAVFAIMCVLGMITAFYFEGKGSER